MPGSLPAFLFVDLAGYTASSWVYGDDHAASLSIRLQAIARLRCGPGDVVVKSIGDAVMCRSETIDGGLRLLSLIWDAADHEPLFPLLRAGIHAGSAVEHHGDYYGSAVNIAARLAGIAAPDEIMASDVLSEFAEQDGWGVTPVGPRVLRNLSDPVNVFQLRPRHRQRPFPVDPVCRLRINPLQAVRHREGGRSVLFCSHECVQTYRVQHAAEEST